MYARILKIKHLDYAKRLIDSSKKIRLIHNVIGKNRVSATVVRFRSVAFVMAWFWYMEWKVNYFKFCTTFVNANVQGFWKFSSDFSSTRISKVCVHLSICPFVKLFRTNYSSVCRHTAWSGYPPLALGVF